VGENIISAGPLPEFDQFFKPEEKEYARSAIHWHEVRPLGSWLVVKADPRVKKTPGGIFLTEALTGIERVMEGTGTIMRAGPDVEEVAVGDRIVFRGFLKDASRGMLTREDDCDVFFLKEEDALVVFTGDVAFGAFSSRRDDDGTADGGVGSP
jgi:co-chaperonin GroES (HSP10)